jgi:hypothetical protein
MLVFIAQCMKSNDAAKGDDCLMMWTEVRYQTVRQHMFTHISRISQQ